MAAEDDKNGPDMGGVRFEDLAHMEEEFDQAELEILRQQQKLYEPLYAKRHELISKIQHFWSNVLEAAPPDLDQYIQPSDSQALAALTDFSVAHFEMDNPKGSPKSFSLKFTFDDNDFFEDKVIEKKFWFRRSTEGLVGLISEPVPIKWKAKQDLTKGLNDAVLKLFQRAEQEPKEKHETLPEYQSLLKAFEDSGDAQSFFTLFSFVCGPGRTYISAEESAASFAAHQARMAKRKAGEEVEEQEPEEPAPTDDAYELIAEVFPAGEDIANLLADEIWPDAIRYYQEFRAMEFDDEDLSDMEVDDEDDDEDSGEEAVDIRALVSGKGKSDGNPPSKKRKA